MTQHEVARTLVKSAPELWEVCSDQDALARHLEAFGEIRITRVEPETTVAWEGERASGTVRIEPSGWGTRVTLTATRAASAEPEPVGEVALEPAIEAVPAPATEAASAIEIAFARAPQPELDQAALATAPRPGFFRRLGGLLFRSLVSPVEVPEDAFGSPDAPASQPAVGEPAAGASREASADAPAQAVRPAAEPDPGLVLASVLDKLGRDHHRPFSRS